MMRPMLALLTFETQAATMSVPPDEPLCMKHVPTPTPQRIAPKTSETVRSGISGCPRPMKNPSQTPMASATTVTPKMVRSTNVRPTILYAMARSTRLSA